MALRAWRAWRRFVDGRTAGLPAVERERMERLQLDTMHAPTTSLVQVLSVFGLLRVALVEAGLMAGSAFSLGVGLALVAMLVSAVGFARLSAVGPRAGAGVAFLAAFVVVLLGPPGEWPRVSGLALAGVILLPAMIIPLLVRWWVVWILVVMCVGLVVVLTLVADGVAASTRMGLYFYLLLAFASGLMLRRSRADLVAHAISSLESAWSQANTDLLTRLLNRRGWLRHTREVFECRSTAGECIAVLFIDIDHFKQLNDLHGHQVGDQVLARLGRVIRARLGEGDLGARLGGEELACLLRGSSPESAGKFAERVRRDFRARNIEYGSTISVGIAFRARGENLGELMARADEAMYRAKSQGRDQVVVASGGDEHETSDASSHTASQNG